MPDGVWELFMPDFMPDGVWELFMPGFMPDGVWELFMPGFMPDGVCNPVRQRGSYLSVPASSQYMKEKQEHIDKVQIQCQRAHDCPFPDYSRVKAGRL